MNVLTGFLIFVAGTVFGYILCALLSVSKPNREDIEEQYRQFVLKGSADQEAEEINP